MAKLIRFPKTGQAELIANDWQVFRATEGEESAALPQGKVIVPFSWWLTRGTKEQHQARSLKGEIGVWFSPEDDVLAHADAISEGLKVWPILAVDFPIFRDGRGYSTAALLRERFSWGGELRAIGDVLIDQLILGARSGFDSFALRADQNTDVALKQFDLFTVTTQNSWRDRRSQLDSQISSQLNRVA